MACVAPQTLQQQINHIDHLLTSFITSFITSISSLFSKFQCNRQAVQPFKHHNGNFVFNLFFKFSFNSSFTTSIVIKIDSIETRFDEVKVFFIKHSFESKACAFRMFKIFYIILTNSIARENARKDTTIKKRENSNKILNVHQTEIFHGFIRSLFVFDILFIKSIVFNAIKHLKRSQNSIFEDSILR